MSQVHITSRQEAFSAAYVRAIAATAGYRFHEGTQPDDDSVDCSISARGGSGTVRSPRLDLQLKCHLGSPSWRADGTWSYSLYAKNYEDLRHTNVMVPRLLVVVAVRDDGLGWITQDEQQLIMRCCGWWHSLRGQPATTNTHTVRVPIARARCFNTEALDDIMQRLERGEAL